jgi:MoaA/NifB/PqqE/SkfB family radical SAM enzyme
MTCPAVDHVTQEWTTEFRSRAARDRIPLSATLELTRRCNFRCAHCYLGDQACQNESAHQELSSQAIKGSLSEWVESGCLYLTLTGGDPMLRPDFKDIYRHARELGMVVTVFCNGTLVTDEIISLFQELPPRKVEISIYGATPETAAAVTGVPLAYQRAWEGIRKLRAGGIRIGLKTLLLTTNQHEFKAMEQQAEELGVGFRHDAALFPCLNDGSKVPLLFRVTPEEAVTHDLATSDRRQMWREKIERTAAFPEDNQLYSCSAGLTTFHADPFGGLSPCLMAKRYRIPAQTRSFQEVWADELTQIRHRKRSRPGGSFSGKWRGACAHCPAFNQLETGDEEEESEYMKKTTRLRYEAAMSTEAGGLS